MWSFSLKITTMKGKILKHKHLKDTFGVFMENKEIGHCSTPYLFPMTATIEDMKSSAAILLEDPSQLDDYDLIEVDLIPILGTELATNYHTHKGSVYPGYPNFRKGVIPEFKDAYPRSGVDVDNRYNDIENLVIGWSNDGTKTAGVLTRRILEYLKDTQ
jgi:hypothetical protein